VILKYAGQDATKPYSEVHDSSLLLKTLPPSSRIGTLDTSTSTSAKPPAPQFRNDKPPLLSILSAHDFETVAEKTLGAKAWAFYSSAATDLITLKANKSFFDRVWFRPRVLRDVSVVSTACRIQGVESSLPLFVAPAALAKMVHPRGEMGIAAACARKGIVQCVSMWEIY
jgi:L-lactate dehydrogenase (cytochrome)